MLVIFLLRTDEPLTKHDVTARLMSIDKYILLFTVSINRGCSISIVQMRTLYESSTNIFLFTMFL